jgi:hypothetical protein
LEQLLENEYPLPSWMSEISQLSDDWLQVPECKTNSPDRVLALDCEMVSLTYKIYNRDLSWLFLIVHNYGWQRANPYLHSRL